MVANGGYVESEEEERGVDAEQLQESEQPSFDEDGEDELEEYIKY